MRKIEIVHLTDLYSNDISEVSRVVPSLPVFEDAFCAFGRGALVATERGQVAVEDLLPGDRVRTADAGFQTLLWKGSTVISAAAQNQAPHMGHLTRLTADALGIARPMPDLVLGPCARLAHRSSGVRRLTGFDVAAIAARDFIDGVNILELTPPTTVPVFHLGFSGHHRIVANGVEVETYHPGPAHLFALKGDLMSVFLSCFPHIKRIEDFGPPQMPVLRLSDLDLFEVA